MFSKEGVFSRISLDIRMSLIMSDKCGKLKKFDTGAPLPKSKTPEVKDEKTAYQVYSSNCLQEFLSKGPDGCECPLWDHSAIMLQ